MSKRILALVLALVAGTFGVAAQELRAPNIVAISDKLVTSGQPGADALGRLAAQGYGAVIDLAPPGMPDAVAGEAEMGRVQGPECLRA